MTARVAEEKAPDKTGAFRPLLSKLFPWESSFPPVILILNDDVISRPAVEHVDSRTAD